MRWLPEPGRESLTLASVLHALGDPVRLQLVRRAEVDPDSTCAAVSDGLAVPLSTLTNHFRILREAGVISMSVDGRHRRIRLRGDDLRDRFPDLLEPILRLSAAEAPKLS
ncbi:ArsR/SmtB family transcription factor [Actinocrispum wychmicini]|uniref:DNA-binding transcriptional ArsR family regulator n=1 Tax=Actinocrispum wychmicini TaxID=1213861 RepID=A0A4R2JUP0_9PSEU|nr:helix-turn-helix domain-containing protein [Actinocrispum wychmicini]TCO60986.1 DNA-binding transcriptional ArsR family regulator [Actinocrispum wychmicini]